MEKSSFSEESTVRHEFDRICKMALKGEMVNHFRHMDYLCRHEVMMSAMSEKELNRLFTMDEYKLEKHNFQVLDYDIEVNDVLIAKALQKLTEKKRNVILLSYFLEMSDAEIAREMHLVRSTIHEHRKRSLELLKNIMEGSTESERL